MRKSNHDQSQPMQVIHPDAAGIDVAAEVLYVATNPERSDRPIRRFGAMTADLREVVEFLLSVGATTVALESTGPYWLVLYAELSKAGLSPILVDPRQAKQPSRRKTDVADAEWIRQLHVLGRFDGAFVVTGDALKMRELGRRRCDRIEHQGQAVIVMQEQLSRMNIKLQHVIRDLAGKTGLAIVDAILAGERDAERLARLRDPRCKHPTQLIARSLEGTWREECVFVLRQAREDYQHFQAQIEQIDKHIEALLEQVAAKTPSSSASPASAPIKPKRCSNKHAPQFPAQQLLATILGTDLTSIPGTTSASLLKLIGELGFSHQPWPTSKHFARWLKLCPDPQRSGDKTIRGRRYPATATRAAQILKEMALGLQHDRGPLGQKLRAVRARKGHDFAIKATAHQLAIVIYACWRSQKPFDPEHHRRGIEHLHDRRIQSLKRQAKELGYVLEPAA